MTAIFAFDEADELLHRTRRDTASSINSFEDRWQHNAQEQEDFDLHPRARHFGVWTNGIIAEEEETPLRVGTPPIPIPNGHAHAHGKPDMMGSSVKVDFDQDFVASGEGLLNKKMVPGDFDYIRVLGKGGYGTVLLVRHKVSGKLFAQKQLKKASLVVQTKIVGIILSCN